MNDVSQYCIYCGKQAVDTRIIPHYKVGLCFKHIHISNKIILSVITNNHEQTKVYRK
jgi:hypothetical protein